MTDQEQAASQDESAKSLPHLAYAPFDPQVDFYLQSQIFGMGQGTMVPLEYTGWRDEELSWKNTCYLHAGLNPAPTLQVTGPDATRFFSDHCVNTFTNFPAGTLKHAIMCNDEGLVMAHGALLRLGEDDYLSYFLAPYAAYKFYSGGYKAQAEWVNDWFIFQVAGPRSLEVLETVTGQCLHDIPFGHHRASSINGIDVRISRMGMAGTLAYEVHGPTTEAVPIYNAIMEAGAPFGIRKLGLRAYQMNHTPGGFPQSFVHFPPAWGEDKGFMGFLHIPEEVGGAPGIYSGSMGSDIRPRYRNPVELGWAKGIKFDHDFVGRPALEREVQKPRRFVVTLSWNVDDVLDIHASYYREGEPYKWMEPIDLGQHRAMNHLCADKVLKNGKEVGVSSGRVYSYYFRQMLSLCSIDVEHSELGTEVEVLWGDPGTRQKAVRATVSRFPFLNENRNETVDVTTIPCAGRKK
ncbi:MAG: aminomethyl transferase family protein [Actinomycetia bacterium]|nr:aminomethyl transferase family protein [Actinomycetes bacterium]